MPPDNTTKICSRCHEEKPLTTEHFYRGVGKDGWEAACKTCLAASRKAYKAKNKAREAAANAAWYKRTIEERRAASRAKYRRTIEDNPNHNKEYYEAHKEQHKKATTKWAKANPDALKAKDHRRRAKQLQAEGNHTKEDIKAQYKAQRGKCYYCGIKVGATYHVDHVMPLARGGSNAPDNLVIACRQCNQRKSDRMPHEWPEGNRLL